MEQGHSRDEGHFQPEEPKLDLEWDELPLKKQKAWDQTEELKPATSKKLIQVPEAGTLKPKKGEKMSAEPKPSTSEKGTATPKMKISLPLSRTP